MKKSSISRRGFLKSTAAGAAVTAGASLAAACTSPRVPEEQTVRDEPSVTRMRDVGWVWEGQPAYVDFPPSMYGLGEGCKYFGLSKAYYLYHGNNEPALAKLRHLDQVICDISIWRYRKVVDAEGAIGWGLYHEKSPEVMVAEAETVSRLSLTYPNVFGAMLDDLFGAIQSEGYTPATCSDIRAALKSHNPELRTCATVYTNELQSDNWDLFGDLIDVVFLWVWKSEDLVALDNGVEQCRQLFPDKPIVLGCYIREYGLQAPVPMDRLQYQWERIPGYLDSGKITGFCILGAYLIDRHAERAQWIRNFITQH